MEMLRYFTTATVSLLAAGSLAAPALAAKPGGILNILHRDSPPSMSIHEEATISTSMPIMGVFNNLVIFDPKEKQNKLTNIVPDLAETLIALSEKDEAFGNTWNVAGPGLITTRQFADLVFDAVHQKPRLRVAGKFMLRVAGLFNPVLRELVEMHYLWTTPVKLDDTRLRQLLPNLHKTPYPEGIRQTIDGMQTGAVAAQV